jgi:hypothetical protein
MAPADHVASCRADHNPMGRIEVQAGPIVVGEGEIGKMTGRDGQLRTPWSETQPAP